ncbi:MAG: hypothetical protein APF81_16685 [Desulfosporosinus sp. BRH_c37]|nr:MAG: hypothetical protein APF81_16685 [Desulfosporosinus sp. BRH_c37]
MLNKIKTFWQEEEGMGTVEILMIVGVLVAIAVFFRKTINVWVTRLVSGADPAIQKSDDLPEVVH